MTFSVPLIMLQNLTFIFSPHFSIDSRLIAICEQLIHLKTLHHPAFVEAQVVDYTSETTDDQLEPLQLNENDYSRFALTLQRHIRLACHQYRWSPPSYRLRNDCSRLALALQRLIISTALPTALPTITPELASVLNDRER